MHRGVREFVRWLEDNRGQPDVNLSKPATSRELDGMEQQLGGPLPTDLRHILTRFNGGALPSGTLLPAGLGPGTIEAEVRRFAEEVGADFLDPELFLPFHRTLEGSLLCFDRSAGPVSDTWPIVDYDEDTGDIRVVHRTFDGWCAYCVAQWSAPDFREDFNLDKYLRTGARHVAVEPDVASAHATVAHAFKRAGNPELALDSYLQAARCVPSLPWCDWEALKLAVLLDKMPEALEAAGRLCGRAPGERWALRETTPGAVADLAGRMAVSGRDDSPWVRLLDQLIEQAEGEEREHAVEVRRCVVVGEPLPAVKQPRQSLAPAASDPEQWWRALEQAYHAGHLREDDLLFDPQLQRVAEYRPLADLLRIRRDF
ncbi:MAG: SMI1/KNR4 family protein [Myxococcota bacterium]